MDDRNAQRAKPFQVITGLINRNPSSTDSPAEDARNLIPNVARGNQSDLALDKVSVEGNGLPVKRFLRQVLGTHHRSIRDIKCGLSHLTGVILLPD